MEAMGKHSHLSFSGTAQKKDEFITKLNIWKQAKSDEGGDKTAEYMERAYKNKDKLIILYKKNITTYPPMYAEATQVVCIDSPSLLNAPLIRTQVFGKRMVDYADKYIYQKCPDNMNTNYVKTLYVDSATGVCHSSLSYIEDLNDWWLKLPADKDRTKDENRAMVANYMEDAKNQEKEVICLYGLKITECPPMYSEVTYVIVLDCPELSNESLDAIEKSGIKVVHIRELGSDYYSLGHSNGELMKL
jgi:hypothetical protein